MKNEEYKLLCDYLRKQRYVFFRYEPNALILNSKFLILGRKDINPPATLVLDITPDESTLLANMHEKTRYNIRLAEKKGLRVTVEKNFDIFWNLLQKTGQRDDFMLHSRVSYETIMNSENVKQIIVWSRETPVATAGLIGFPAQGGSASGGGDTMYYLYGASDHTYRNLMGPHLMQWEAIQLAKKLGYAKYDFFGVAPASPPFQGGVGVVADDKSAALSSLQGRQTPPNLPLERGGGYEYDPNHRYAGVTRFKLGFGGAVHEEPGTFDLIINKNKYMVYRVLKTLRGLFQKLS